MHVVFFNISVKILQTDDLCSESKLLTNNCEHGLAERERQKSTTQTGPTEHGINVSWTKKKRRKKRPDRKLRRTCQRRRTRSVRKAPCPKELPSETPHSGDTRHALHLLLAACKWYQRGKMTEDTRCDRSATTFFLNETGNW